MRFSLSKVAGFVTVALASIALTIGGALAAHAVVNPGSGPSAGGTTVTIDGIKFQSVYSGEDFSLGLTDKGTVYAWGRNTYGQLGDGTTTTSYTPVPVLNSDGTGVLSGVTELAVGFYHALAITNSGVYSWGINTYGELGNSTTTHSSLPVRVQGVGGTGYLTGVTSVAAGGYHSMALTQAGVYAWGLNNSGQLGDNTLVDAHAPVQVLGVGGTGTLSGITHIAAGSGHSLASSASAVFSWGANGWGQLGNSTNTNSLVPVRVVGQGGSGFLSGADSLVAGSAHSLALIGGYVYSWGFNAFGQLGNGTTTATSSPILVLNSGGTSPLGGVLAISSSNYSSFAITSSATYAWGWNAVGELANGSTTSASLPVAILAAQGSSQLTGVSSIDGGNELTNAVVSGVIYSAGSNTYGQFGNGGVVNANRLVIGPNFQPSTIRFGAVSGSGLTTSGSAWTVVTPSGTSGSVLVTGVAHVFGGSAAASPSSVAWDAGTFTYEAALANTGTSNNLSAMLVSGGAIVLGLVLLVALRRMSQK